MASFKQMQDELRRIAILRFLLVTPARTVNTDILKMVLNERGIVTAASDLESDLFFLSNNECIEIKYNFEKGDEKLKVIVLTEKGEDVAVDRAIVPGIRRPRRGDNLPEIPESELGVPYGSR